MLYLFYLLFFLTPLLVTSITSELFELPKMYFIYTITILATSLHLLYIVNKKQVFLKPHPLIPALLVFLLSQTISTFFSIDKFTSFFGYYGRFNGGLLSTFCFVLLFLIYNTYKTDSSNTNLIRISLLSGFFVSIYAIGQHFGIDAHLWQQDVKARVFSTLGQPNWLAAYFCILIPLVFKHKNPKFYHYILFTLFCISLVFTKSQSGILSCVFSLFLIIIFNLKNKKFYLLNLLFALILFIIPNPIQEKIFPKSSNNQPIVKPETGEVLNITASGDIRKIVWSGAINIAKRFPIFGTGPETFAQSYYWVRPREHNDTSEWNFLYNKAHNEYLNILANTGFFGFFSYIFLIFTTIRHLLFLKKDWVIFASFSSILVTNFFGFSISLVSLYFFLSPLLCSKKD